jgi:hypothetical protein
MILDFTPTPLQLDSMRDTFAALTGFPAASIELQITVQRDSTVEARLTGANAGAAGNLITSTLIMNPSYLMQQDPTLGLVRTAQIEDTSSSGLSGGQIAGIVIGSVLGATLIVILLILLIKHCNKSSNKKAFYKSDRLQAVEMDGK